MTPFRFEHEFHGEEGRYWQLFFDEEATVRQFKSTGIEDYSIDELVRGDDEWRRVIRVTPARDLPAVIRKVTGASLGYTETSVYTPSLGTAVTTVVTSTLSGRIDFSGTHSLESTGPSSFKRIFEGSVEVRVALVGKRIEKLILADMEESYAVGAKLTQAGLSESPQTIDS